MVRRDISLPSHISRESVSRTSMHDKLTPRKTEERRKSPKTSYEVHQLCHTDTTAAGRKYSYPQNSKFSWESLYLKKSWAPGRRNQPSKSNPSKSIDSPQSTRNWTREDKTRSSSKFSFPTIEKNDRRHFRSCSEQALSAIPENAEAMYTLPATVPNLRQRARNYTTHQRKSRNSSGLSTSTSRMSDYSISTSVMSSELPTPLRQHSFSLNDHNSADNNTTRPTRQSDHASLSTSQVTNSKKSSPAFKHGTSRVERTVDPERIKQILKERSLTNYQKDFATPKPCPLRYENDTRRHQSFTFHELALQLAADKVRLRSSLYHREPSIPTLGRKGLLSKATANSRDNYNKVHSDITRPLMVDVHKHKHPSDIGRAFKWTNRASVKEPWTTYISL